MTVLLRRQLTSKFVAGEDFDLELTLDNIDFGTYVSRVYTRVARRYLRAYPTSIYTPKPGIHSVSSNIVLSHMSYTIRYPNLVSAFLSPETVGITCRPMTGYAWLKLLH